MIKLRIPAFAIVLFAMMVLAMGGTLLSLNGCGGTGASSPPPPPPPGKIQHVVVIFQENRTPDNLFQDSVLINRGADIAQSGTDSTGHTIQLKKISLQEDYNPDHSHGSFEKMCDLNPATGQCQMDGANLVSVACNVGAKDCPAPDLQFGYVDPTATYIQPYFQLAEQYTFADRMFQTNQGPSFPAHQFIISGTSAPVAGSKLFASENTNSISAGCDAAAETSVKLIDPAGSETSNAPIYPCFEHQTLTDLLEAKSLTWRYYTPGTSPPPPLHGSPAIWNGPEAIQHICGPNLPPPNGTACVGADWTNNVVLDQKQILTDITNNQLRDVSWVIPGGRDSDHAGSSGTTGPSWVASVVNAIGNSPYWANTAIFITWDDWGGWYDHVAPPLLQGANCAQWGCGYVYGFRVPLIVVSPYVKAQHISKTQHDFGSILKFIEARFSLPSLGYADAVADDFSDCFDFNQTPLKFQTINAPFDAQYFLNDTTPPTDPDDD